MAKSESTVLVLKTDVYAAAWRLKRAVFKYRMRLLRREAIKAASRPTLWQRMCGVRSIAPSEMQIRDAMKTLWNTERGRWGKMEDWHIGWWGGLGDAKRLIKLTSAPGSKYVRLSSNDAATLSKYWSK